MSGRSAEAVSLAVARESRNVDIVERLLSGEDVKAVAAAHGISDRQVYRILKDDDYKAILEQGQREQVALLPKANRKVAELIDSKDDKIALSASQTVFKNVGITPAHTQNVFIQTLFMAKNIALVPQLLQALQDNMVVDADYEVIEDK